MNTELKAALTESIVQVTFTKKDGTVREMRCTLMPEYAVYGDTKESQRRVNEEVQPVFDLDVQQWRSFRWDTVTEWQPDLFEVSV
jgi:hypothetical protein